MRQGPGPAGWSSWTALLVLALLVSAVFFRVPGYQFVNLDTSEPVIHNPYIRGLSGENLKHIFSSWCMTSYYPIRTLSFAVDYQIWGLDPRGFKLTNVLLHLANVFLVFWLVLRLLRLSAVVGESPQASADVLAAMFSAAIFAVHPVVVESVSWVAGREELLMTLGALGCVHFHLQARWLAEARSKTLAVAAYHAGGAFCCAAACLSNALAAVIPLLITAWDVIFLARPRLWKVFSGTSALWAIGIATIVLKRIGGSAVPYVPEFGVFSTERLALVLNVYWLNIETLLRPTRLAVSYWYVSPEGLDDLEVILGGTALGLTCLALWFLRQRKSMLFGLVWFGLALAPAAQIMPHHIHRADRFLYLPLAGIVLVVGMGLKPLGNALKGRVPSEGRIAAGALAVLVLAAMSTAQVRTWRDSCSMWENCVAVVPGNAYAHGSLAEVLADQRQFKEAIPHYEKALEITPDSIEALDNFAYRLATCHQEELRDYDRAVVLAERGCRLTNWKDLPIRRTLATAYMNSAHALGAEHQYARAIRGYANAMEADPTYGAACFNLALLLATCDDERFRQPDKAVRLAERACELAEHPDSVQLSILAEVYGLVGRFDEAAAKTEKAIQLAESAADNPEWTDKLRHRLDLFRNHVLPEALR